MTKGEECQQLSREFPRLGFAGTLHSSALSGRLSGRVPFLGWTTLAGGLGAPGQKRGAAVMLGPLRSSTGGGAVPWSHFTAGGS